jgi:hypothetical protein
MFRVKITSNHNCQGISLVILWILGISFVHTVERGDHLHMGICVGPIEFNFGTSIWRKWLP